MSTTTKTAETPHNRCEDALWAAINANPNTPAAQLATAAGIGVSTTYKILSRWEKDGTATRTRTADAAAPRTPDFWTITPEPTCDPEPRVTPTGPVTEPRAGAGTKLAHGELRGMVEDHLTEHPDTDFSPHEIGKALNRSSGAVNNALEKLTATGTAQKTNDHPKKFRLAHHRDKKEA